MRNPSKSICVALDVNTYEWASAGLRASRATVFTVVRASDIWLATKRLQTRSYSLSSAESIPSLFAPSGVSATLVGRIASCAPCASAFDLKKFGVSG